jgi:hypothetical protein
MYVDLLLLVTAHLPNYLQLFLFVTKEVSKSSCPRIHQVIPLMDGLFDTLDDYASDSTKLPAVRMAAIRGLAILKKYYGKTDESTIFRIAMSELSFVSGLRVLIMS